MPLYAVISVVVINLLAAVVIARLGRRLSTTEERVEPLVEHVQREIERVEHADHPPILIGSPLAATH